MCVVTLACAAEDSQERERSRSAEAVVSSVVTASEPFVFEPVAFDEPAIGTARS